MRASDLLRDLLGPEPPANLANPAKTRAYAGLAGLRTAANACESGAAGCEIRNDSQRFTTAESKQSRGHSQHSQDSQPVRPKNAAMTDYEARVRDWLREIGETNLDAIEQIVANALADPHGLSNHVPPPEGPP